jgi:hypothetical protein
MENKYGKLKELRNGDCSKEQKTRYSERTNIKKGKSKVQDIFIKKEENKGDRQRERMKFHRIRKT